MEKGTPKHRQHIFTQMTPKAQAFSRTLSFPAGSAEASFQENQIQSYGCSARLVTSPVVSRTYDLRRQIAPVNEVAGKRGKGRISREQ